VDGRKRVTLKKDVYQIITDRIIALLEAGAVPWRKPWKGGGPPQNLISRKTYRGINVFLLNSARFASPFWLSFKQVQSIGTMVRKGEHAFPVVFWKLCDVEGDGMEREEKQKRAPLLRYYKVFNIEQCENVEPSLLPKLQTGTSQPLEQCDRLVAQMPKRPDIVHGGARATYCPLQDRVTMPNVVLFDSPEFYYSTLFHELTHATGHASRLSRTGITEPAGFGSDPYSREELVAEMGAAFLCGHCGIENRTIDESARYIQGWLDRLRNDRKLVVHAAAQAQKACDFILDAASPEAPEGGQ
jgi:antirestriction protein ArdC